ncbi:unnamed protein product [Cercospora beticola]|nr:unnamed protein product [Cercospora beticola]
MMHLLSLDEYGELSLGTYDEDKCPPYAILSHTWYADEDEVTYNDVINGRGKNKLGYDKIMFCGEQAKKDDLQHFWVDSCCIDKTSSAELSESLNSMFRWYQRASKCYVYLFDVEMTQNNRHASTLGSWKTAFQKSRWFTRGWTLQELIAPEVVEFWSSDRYMLGTKADLSDLIHEWTELPLRALKGAPVASFSINERLRWAASRETKKSEDKAYCLLGIFEVFMPPIYGEGGDHAFDRLKKAIDDKLRLSLQDRGEAHHDRGEKVNEHRKSVLKSLGFQELGARQANIRNTLGDTCEWVPEHRAYVKWTCSDRKTFWIVGKPGAGKSTLMKFLHSKAKKEKSDYDFVFGFFFNARGTTLEKTTNGMYRALLFELFTAFPELQITLDGKQPSDDWTLYLLKSLLSTTMQKIGPRTLRLFVDALDECDEHEIQEMVEFMEELEDDVSEGNGMLSICFASRHYPSIIIHNGVRLNLDEETGHLRDLDKYIKQRLLTGEESTLVHAIHEEVRRKANGVFLWAVLVINILDKDIHRGRISYMKKRLDEIPSGLTALFQDILRRDNEAMEEFLLCMQWILFAKRPLQLEEFFFAMRSGSDGYSAPESVWLRTPWLSDCITSDHMRRFVQSSSKGLAKVTIEATYHGSRYSPTVQFIHESVRDFIIKDGQLFDLFPSLGNDFRSWSHESLKNCCSNYLALDVSEIDEYICLGPPAIARDYPFLCYASNYLLHHANEAAETVAQDRLFEIYPREHHITIETLVDREEQSHSTPTNRECPYFILQLREVTHDLS